MERVTRDVGASPFQDSCPSQTNNTLTSSDFDVVLFVLTRFLRSGLLEHPFSDCLSVKQPLDLEQACVS